MMNLHTIFRRSLLGCVCLAFLLVSGAARAQALSGSYTIDPSGSGSTNFTTFSAAVSALQSKGVSGPVVFNVAPGTYSEQLTLTSISGASSTNTITFDGGSRDKVTLQYNATSSSNRHTIRFHSSSYYTVRNMTIKGLGKSYGWVVQFYSSAHYNTVSNCDILADSTNASRDFIPVIVNGSTSSYSSGTNCHDFLIDSCYLNGGYYSVYVASSGGYNHQVKNSYLKDAYYAAVYMSSSGGIKCINNKVDFPAARYTYNYGFYFINGSATSGVFHEITHNQIMNTQYSGMTFHTVHGNTSKQSVIANNMVGGGFRNGSNGNGIFMNLCARWDVYHNTVNYDATASGTTATAFYLNAGSGTTDFRNNNLVMSATSGTATPAYLITASRFSDIDFNNYYNAADSTSTLYLDGYYSNVSLVGAQGYNKNSTAKAVTFVANTDLHLVKNHAVLVGDPSVGILEDMDGDPRCPFGPTPGADEADYSSIVLEPDFVLPDTITIGTPIDLKNTSKYSVPVKFNWNYGGNTVSSDDEIRFAFQNTGKDSIQLEMVSCYGTKRIYKSLEVVLPAGPPKSDYVSDINETYVDGPVKLMDLSTGGPSGWKWEILPATISDPQMGTIPSHKYLNGTSSSSQFPEIAFAAPGDYTICLTASNTKGNGNKACKPKYVTVYDAYNMCTSTKKALQSKGFLFDEGGPTGNYDRNHTGNNVCEFVISPCNSQRTVLYMHSFDLRTGDYLRVYDGADASGTPLYNHQHYPYGLTGSHTDANFPDSLVASSGKMFIQFESDNSTTTLGPGFEAFWSSHTPNLQPPVASFDAPDTICSNVQVNFMGTTQGDDLSYSWDMDGDGIEDASGEDALWVFFGGGTYTVELTVTGCGGSGTVKKDIVVIDPTTVPGADFEADAVVAGTDDVVTLMNKTTGCGESYTWEITPSTFQYAPGYSKSSVSPKVIFTDSGRYTVKLTAVNSQGFKTIEKVDYIQVIKYCRPDIAGYRKDIGISRVAIQKIDNVTAVDNGGYVNFTAGMSATMERGAEYTVRIDRPSGPNEVNRGVWVDWNQDGDFSDADEFIGEDTSTLVISWDATVKVPKTAALGAARMRIGTITASETITPCGPHSLGEYEDYRIFVSTDVTAPEIILKGADTVTVEIGTTYNDSGATAIDNVDGDITSQMNVIDAIDTSVPDTNVVIYSVTDAAGNKTTKYRYVIVLPDDLPPVAELVGPDTVYMDVHSAYIDSGVTYSDKIDGQNLIVTVDNQVDTAKLGTYMFTYHISDQTGNSVSISRTVIVVDNESPMAMFQNGDTVQVEVFYPYLESDLVITDNYDSVFTVQRSGNFNFKDNIPTVLGDTFYVTYTVTDQSGNVTTVMRNIHVIDTTAPVIRLVGNDVVHIKRWHTYTDSGYTVSDNYDQSPTVTTSGNFDNTLLPGTFYIKYTAEDQSGNQSVTVTRIVIVDENVSVEEVDGAGYNVRAYPNPSSGRFVIETDLPNDRQLRMALYDMNGREIKLLRNGLGSTQLYEVDLSAEARGIYMLRVDMSEKTLYHKIVIVK